MEVVDVVNDGDGNSPPPSPLMKRIRLDGRSPLDVMSPGTFKERLHGGTRPDARESPSSSPESASSNRTSYLEVSERSTSPLPRLHHHHRLKNSTVQQTSISQMHINTSLRNHPFHRSSRRSVSPSDDRSDSPPVFHPPPPSSAIHGALPPATLNGILYHHQRPFADFNKRDYDRVSPAPRSPVSPRSVSPHHSPVMVVQTPEDHLTSMCTSPLRGAVHSARSAMKGGEHGAAEDKGKPASAPS